MTKHEVTTKLLGVVTSLFVLCAVVSQAAKAAEKSSASAKPHIVSSDKLPDRYPDPYLMVGLTKSVGSSLHAGPELGLGWISCGREGVCAVGGPFVGVMSPREMSTGIGGGIMLFPATTWTEVAAHWTRQGFSGGHFYVAAGAVVMMYAGVNHSTRERATRAEFGVTMKWLVGVTP